LAKEGGFLANNAQKVGEKLPKDLQPSLEDRANRPRKKQLPAKRAAKRWLIKQMGRE
jgi:hypothetical protein